MKERFSQLNELRIKNVLLKDEANRFYSAEGLIDTGSLVTIIPKDVANQITLRDSILKEMEVITGLGVVKIPTRVVPVIILGEIIIKNVVVGVHELPDPATKILVGMNILKQLKTTIDGKERTFELVSCQN